MTQPKILREGAYTGIGPISGGSVKISSVGQKRIRANIQALLVENDRSNSGRVERGDNNVAVLTLLKVATALATTIAALMKQAKLYRFLLD